MPQSRDAKLFQVLRREGRKDPFVNLIFAECGLVLFNSEAPQPPAEVHDGARMAYHS